MKAKLLSSDLTSTRARVRHDKSFRSRVERIFVCGLLVIALWTFIRWANPPELSSNDLLEQELWDAGFSDAE
jgi:hypothetical protein